LGISSIYFERNYDFKSYSGFDISKTLILLGKSIVNSNNSSVDLKVGNAESFKLSEKPLICFAFNPFGCNTFNKFLNNNIKKIKENNSILLYANDLHINELNKNFKLKVVRNNYYNLSAILFKY